MPWQPINKWDRIPLFLGNAIYDDGNIIEEFIYFTTI